MINIKTISLILITIFLSACGGGNSPTEESSLAVSKAAATSNTIVVLPTKKEAARWLSQASFGARDEDIAKVTGMGYEAWLNQQFALPALPHVRYVTDIKSTVGTVAQNNFMESFWQQAVNGSDALRQRVTFALSQIFVVSFQDGTVAARPRSVAGYYDVLGANAFTNYRSLLEAVTLHPAMGVYLSYLHNQKESGSRVPDQNYAREIMQLFTIGLYELNQDGTKKLVNGRPVETYTNADIVGLSRVFTGWSWAGPDKSTARFLGSTVYEHRDWLPMQSYPQYHSTSEKKFLGTTIAVQPAANPEASLKIALDRLFNHPNVGPFFGKQLIQRLVTSNPSPQYVGRVAAAFANNGAGVRGDMKAVIRAVLLDPEARTQNLSNAKAGKINEPIMRLANWMRAFHATSTSSRFLLNNLDDPLSSLGQTTMRAPSVFNFYRPHYIPPNTTIAAAGLVAPEMQITGETSVVGYLNFLADIIPNGVGSARDVQANYAADIALADDPKSLVDHVDLLLMSGSMSATLRNQILAAVNSIAISKDNAISGITARKNRAQLAIFLTMASPEYLVRK